MLTWKITKILPTEKRTKKRATFFFRLAPARVSRPTEYDFRSPRESAKRSEFQRRSFYPPSVLFIARRSVFGFRPKSESRNPYNNNNIRNGGGTKTTISSRTLIDNTHTLRAGCWSGRVSSVRLAAQTSRKDDRVILNTSNLSVTSSSISRWRDSGHSNVS